MIPSTLQPSPLSPALPRPRTLRPAEPPSRDAGNEPVRSEPSLRDAVAPGRLVELVGPAGRAAVTTAAAALVAEVQREEPVLWVDATNDLYPPDLAAAGVDLERLIFVRLSRVRAKQLTAELLEAAEIALRSGAFGLVLVTMPRDGDPASLQRGLARLAQLARHHRSRVVLLRRAEAAAPSLGSLVSLRLVATPRGEHQVHFELTKDKVALRRAPLALAVKPPAGVREHVHIHEELPTPKTPDPLALEPELRASAPDTQTHTPTSREGADHVEAA